MDRRGKQRLIGAVILVALAVVVVPELLSGSKLQAPAVANSAQFPSAVPGPVRNVTMDLAGAEGRPAEGRPAASRPGAGRPNEPALLAANTAQTPPASTLAPETATTTAPASASTSPSAPTPAATPAHAGHTLGLPQAPPLESAAAPPISNASFAVQLGSFANRGNADSLLQQLKAQGYRAYESAESAGGAVRYRVRVGPLSDRGSAEKIMARLKAAGRDATLIAP